MLGYGGTEMDQYHTSLNIVRIMEKYNHIQTGLEKNLVCMASFFWVYTTPNRFSMVLVCMVSFCIKLVCMEGVTTFASLLINSSKCAKGCHLRQPSHSWTTCGPNIIYICLQLVKIIEPEARPPFIRYNLSLHNALL